MPSSSCPKKIAWYNFGGLLFELKSNTIARDGETLMEKFSPGLSGVPAAKSKVSYLDGQKGILEYRGISIEQLAEQSTFIETAYLLLFGSLPTKRELNGLIRTSGSTAESSSELRT